MSDDTSTIRIIESDQEQVVSVTVGELKRLYSKSWLCGAHDDIDTDPIIHERTCHNSAPHYLRFHCSECHYVIYHDDANETGEPDEDGIKFCPKCGARVVDE